MRKSLHDHQLIEDYLLCRMSEEQQAHFQLKLLLSTQLQEEVELQKQAYAQIEHYGREKLRQELMRIEEKLFRSPDKKRFRQKILSFFT